MKNLVFGFLIINVSLAFIGCGGAHGDNPGHAYMPDMYYSRAYEAYGYNNVGGEFAELRRRGIFHAGLTVPGTVARGEAMPSRLTADSAGMLAAEGLRNPFDTVKTDAAFLQEGARLYQINCGVCHGTNLDGNGPLWKDGNGAYPAKPQILNDANAKGWTDGHYFHVITFGKGAMGSYASQLRPDQRWQVIKYIRSKQGLGSDSSATSSATPAVPPAMDTTSQQ